MPNSIAKYAQHQSGAALVMSLILLSILTLLALGASQSARTWIMVSANMRNADLALQSAEVGARTAEQFIANLENKPEACTKASCVVFQRDFLPMNLIDASAQWWSDFGVHQKRAHDDSTNNMRITTASTPLSIIEELSFVKDELNSGDGPPPGKEFYRITTRSTQGTSIKAIVQTTYARRF